MLDRIKKRIPIEKIWKTINSNLRLNVEKRHNG